MKPLADKICLVTGANTGIGLETARGLAEAGGTVVMTARHAGKGEAAVADVKRSTGNANVELLLLDLASTASIKQAVSTFRGSHERLHLLVNNAGLILTERRTTEEGFESTFGVNHLGHFLLTHLLLDHLKNSVPARVVNLSSEAHRQSRGLDFDDLMFERRRYSAFGAYGDSKLANILFTRELARRVADTGIVVHAVHPGVVRSGFAADGDVSGWLTWVMAVVRPFLLTPAKGARTSLHVALSDDAGSVTGKYWKRSRQARPAKAARDDRAAKKLWNVSEALLLAER